ncbi:hypothetical protein DUI87_10844 [Hirundo rustica rustica]|uniref:Uncharacterized protein n=1 Tax=Hirundo rustica rustica TaxID=333673 RepID=A0A3M0KJ77_HIRRU|nr:hypothetical protein DUI87_10844 [Hirundo rustica rustica]
MPASSKTDPPLPKDKAISSGSASLKTYLRKQEKTHLAVRGVRKPESNCSADIKDSEEGEEKVLQALEQFFLQPMGKIMAKQAVWLQPMKIHGGVDGCPPWRAPHQSRQMHRRGCDLMGSLAESVDPWREREKPTLEQEDFPFRKGNEILKSENKVEQMLWKGDMIQNSARAKTEKIEKWSEYHQMEQDEMSGSEKDQNLLDLLQYKS